jgi:hypothetical protein
MSTSETLKLFEKLQKEKKVKHLSSRFKSYKLIQALASDQKMAIQLLICHYLGILDSLRGIENTKKQVLLSILFKTEGVENIRKKLSNVGGKNSPLLIMKNLEPIRDLFQELELSDQLKKVEADLQNAKNKENK